MIDLDFKSVCEIATVAVSKKNIDDMTKLRMLVKQTVNDAASLGKYSCFIPAIGYSDQTIDMVVSDLKKLGFDAGFRGGHTIVGIYPEPTIQIYWRYLK